jgi:predicted dehydrogenase
MLKAALEAGKHVYAGVPLAVNEKQAEELVELASRKGVIGASDAYFQYIPAHLEMKHRIDRGDIGDIFSISLDLQINLFNPTTQDFPYYWFRERSNGASVLRNLGTHSITMLTSLFGRVEAAVGVESRKLAEWRSQEGQVYHPEISDTASALLRFAGGFNATLNLSWIDAGPIGWRIDVHGSRGRLTARHEDGFPNHSEVRLLSASHRAPGETVIELSDDFTRSREVAIAHDYRPLPCYPIALSFRRLKAAIDGDGAPSPSLRDALHVERILAAISRSTATQMWESVPE